MEITIGGNRVGSGKKMKGRINNYNRSTHNLSEKFATSAGSGILYPCLCKLAMRGDSFDIGINADCRTIPTRGPLFGSYKMQVDLYQVPVRLYQGILHNNPFAIGLKMNQVKFPTLLVPTQTTSWENRFEDGKMNNSSLLKYLGFSGIGHIAAQQQAGTAAITREINAIPALAYYDIVKNYYANKQEEAGYIISGKNYIDEIPFGIAWNYGGTKKDITEHFIFTQYANFNWTLWTNKGYNKEYLENNINEWTGNIYIRWRASGTQYMQEESLSTLIEYGMEYSIFNIQENNSAAIQFYMTDEQFRYFWQTRETDWTPNILEFVNESFEKENNETLDLVKFDLANIDDMRYELLAHNKLGQTYILGYDWTHQSGTDGTGMPYAALTNVTTDGITYNKYPMNGLCLKTYQNDMFNNWLNIEWLEGENGINELTKVAVVEGEFSMDSLNFATKLYNMLNRVAVAGNTYEDWQDVVYEEVRRKQVESPIFIGGMSQEVIFDEIVQSAPADGQPLGTLGGRGRLAGNKRGGKIHVKVDEASFIIGIMSLTPRQYYTQGNEFYLTDVLTMDDMHKPAMDGIGFQDLIGERMAWWDSVITPNGKTVLHRSKIGKLPAWIEYMTSYDRAYGDFAGEYGYGYMILNRNYEPDEETSGIKDATTYVDPSKYNYAFAYQALDAQNFWVQINFDIKARRLMSARIIPNV